MRRWTRQLKRARPVTDDERQPCRPAAPLAGRLPPRRLAIWPLKSLMRRWTRQLKRARPVTGDERQPCRPAAPLAGRLPPRRLAIWSFKSLMRRWTRQPERERPVLERPVDRSSAKDVGATDRQIQRKECWSGRSADPAQRIRTLLQYSPNGSRNIGLSRSAGIHEKRTGSVF